MLEKRSLFHLTGQVTGAVDVEMGGSLLKEKLTFKALILSIMCRECLTAHLKVKPPISLTALIHIA